MPPDRWRTRLSLSPFLYVAEAQKQDAAGRWNYSSRLMRVDFNAQPEISLGEPQTIVEGSFLGGGDNGLRFRPSADGQRFLMIRRGPDTASRLVIVFNWFEELNRLTPTN